MSAYETAVQPNSRFCRRLMNVSFCASSLIVDGRSSTRSSHSHRPKADLQRSNLNSVERLVRH
jgi:hypothetical protein